MYLKPYAMPKPVAEGIRALLALEYCPSCSIDVSQLNSGPNGGDARSLGLKDQFVCLAPLPWEASNEERSREIGTVVVDDGAECGPQWTWNQCRWAPALVTAIVTGACAASCAHSVSSRSFKAAGSTISSTNPVASSSSAAPSHFLVRAGTGPLSFR